MCDLHAVLLVCETEAGASCSLLCRLKFQVGTGLAQTAPFRRCCRKVVASASFLVENKQSGALTVQESLLLERVSLVRVFSSQVTGSNAAFTVVYFRACGVAKKMYFATVQWQQ